MNEIMELVKQIFHYTENQMIENAIQIIKILYYYIYNKTTDYFEKCYPTCIFCSLERDLSSDISQNCKVCENGYLRSYTFMGNCYIIEYPHNTSKYSNNIGDESYTIVDPCYALNKIPINDTGECVDSCHKNKVFHTYYLNEN